MSDLTDKYLTDKKEHLTEQGHAYIQEIDVGMRKLLDEMFKQIDDLHKHLKKYKKSKDIRQFASGAGNIIQAFSRRFGSWKIELQKILERGL